MLGKLKKKIKGKKERKEGRKKEEMSGFCRLHSPTVADVIGCCHIALVQKPEHFAVIFL